ncbi:proline--tRNA ligase [Paenibacillus sp. FSL R7-0331]|uniref:proline--tRNA ligase n=1 Tax=Paenibacillus sp. FSL R7-0331 TaxID=1536773 RepID=UPI0004F7A408|nr:proline--tRNA ligase [Paenibacillus sp. FSL R7-0331]AIQ53058.1 prolyl-tRNA synthetase [Paenibacillus sp. FSL R7-0331]
MRQSQLLLTTLRDAPAEAETASHRLLLRAGYIRMLASGIYSYLPLGRRVLRRIEHIIREEMDGAGAQEVLLPSLLPAELWKESGRFEPYGKDLMTMLDRHDRQFVLGPTHEEAITALVRGEISSYRKLPVTLYQIQTKFRDELRPRSGLLRGREFLMKDAYSFDADWAGLDDAYSRIFKAYERIFTRCGLNFKSVQANAGAMGGEGGNHEFMALADIGEDTLAVCTSCDYAANLEEAEGGTAGNLTGSDQTDQPAAERFHTPGIRTIGQLEQELQIAPHRIIKTLIYSGGGSLFAVLVRGDHEVNELKLAAAAGIDEISLADYEAVQEGAGVESGYVGPVGLKLPLIIDKAVAAMNGGVAGAGEKDYHLRHVVPGRDFELKHIADIRNASEGETCPKCGTGVYKFHKGIEIGHVFKLGTRYSEKLGAVYLDASGSSKPIIMGCYGIGVSRLMAAIAEQSHDEEGLLWPSALAPYQVHILQLSAKDQEQSLLAEALYGELGGLGIEALLDDRDERAGVKFKDAGLIGIPVVLVIGKAAGEGKVEFWDRKSGTKEIVSSAEAVSRVRGKLNNL